MTDKFDMQKQPWMIRFSNKEEFDIVNKWLLVEFDCNLNHYSPDYTAFTNTDQEGRICHWVMWLNDEYIRKGPKRHEIKLKTKTVFDLVEWPSVETEQQKKIRELEETITKAQEQIQQLKNQN